MKDLLYHLHVAYKYKLMTWKISTLSSFNSKNKILLFRFGLKLTRMCKSFDIEGTNLFEESNKNNSSRWNNFMGITILVTKIAYGYYRNKLYSYRIYTSIKWVEKSRSIKFIITIQLIQIRLYVYKFCSFWIHSLRMIQFSTVKFAFTRAYIQKCRHYRTLLEW